MGCSLEDDVTSGPAPACYHHHLGLDRDQDELMLLCHERVDDDESNDGVVENTSSTASSSRDDVNLSSRHDGAATGGDNGDDSHSNTATALLLNKDMVGVQHQPVEDERKEQQHSLYALRRNPKRSQRFIDEEFALEISAGPTPAGPKSGNGRGPSIFNEKARACTECGKEFSSWKALFGHMRCHPEREWRGIQKPVSIHQLAAKSGLKRSSSKSTKSRSQGQTAPTMSSMSFQEDRAASGLFKVLASDDESDTESIEAAYMNGGGFFSSKSDSNGPRATAGKITGKRSKRQRTIFLQQEAVTGDMKEERDMANCLVMLASAGQKSSEEEQDVSSGTIEQEEEDEEQLAEEMNYCGGKLTEEKQNSTMVAVRGSPGDGNSNSPAMTLFEGTAMAGRNLFVEESGLFGGDELLDHMKYECATCKRIFKSHQALGGHRASHKKVKGCFARTNSDGVQQQQQQAGDDEMTMMVSEDELLLRSDEPLDFQDHYNGHHHGHIVPVFVSPTLAATASASHHRGHLNFAGFKDDMSGPAGYGFNRKQLMKAHECSICHRVFTSGQALGGHKRCHWGGTVDRAGAESQETSSAAAGDNRISSSSSSSKLVLHGETANIVLAQKDEVLDLNLPARGQAGEEQVEVEIVAAGLRREFQQETKIVRKPETESAAAAGGYAFEQLPRLVPAYTLVKRKKEAAATAAKLATKKNSGTPHQLGHAQTTVAPSMATTTTTTTTKMTEQFKHRQVLVDPVSLNPL